MLGEGGHVVLVCSGKSTAELWSYGMPRCDITGLLTVWLAYVWNLGTE